MLGFFVFWVLPAIVWVGPAGKGRLSRLAFCNLWFVMHVNTVALSY